MAGGNVNITISDGGSASIIVPGSSVQLVIGCSASGTVGQIVATRSPATLLSTFGPGPLTEAAALSCLAGGTVLAIKATTATPGSAGSVTTTGGGTSVITVTGNPVDTYYVKVKFTTSTGANGTIGQVSPAIYLQISLDAGRNYGPLISLGSANTYAIGSTGITLNFAAGTIVSGQTITFGTTEPAWSTAGLQSAFNAYQASQYAIAGVGSTHIVGTMTGANCSTVGGYLDTLATGYCYTRSFMSARDASPATIWSGTPETESTWMNAILSDFGSTSVKRACVGAAYWNMPSAFPNPSTTGASVLRRPIAYAAAARQVTIPPQRHLGRVRDGALSNITIDPVNDPNDGFIYHDERINPGLDYIIAGTGGRFMSTMTRNGLPGLYITNPLSMAPFGSDYFLMPLGSVMDVFATILHQKGQTYVDDDVRINANGTIYETDAKAIEGQLANDVNSVMWAQRMISQPVVAGVGIAVDRLNNVKTTNNVNINGTIVSRGYVLTITVTLSYQNPNAAGA